MSVQFSLASHICGINSGSALARSFTYTAKVKLTSSTAGDVLTIVTPAFKIMQLYWNGTAWGLTSFSSGSSVQTALGATPINEWVSAALVFTNYNDGTSNNSRCIAYVKAAGGSVLTATINTSPAQYSDTVGRIFLGDHVSYTSPTGTPLNAAFIGADVKLWSTVLTQSQIEAEWDQQAPVITSNLICANYFDGGSISAALTSDTSNAAYADTWSAVDSDDSTNTNPVYSSDAPTYGPAAPVLSGEDTLPEAPVITGALTATLGAATLASTTTAPRTADLTATLGAATLSSTTATAIAGSLTATLGATTLSSTGVVPVFGDLVVTLGAATLEASDLASTRGVLDATLGAATLSATASAVLVERTGVLSATLGSAGLLSAGTVGVYPLDRLFTATVVDNSLVVTVLATDLSRTVRAVELQATVLQ